MNFLLHSLTNKFVDFQEVAKFVEEDTMPSYMRIYLLELLREYKDTKTVSLWQKKHFLKLMTIVSEYLNIDLEVLKLKKLKSPTLTKTATKIKMLKKKKE